jgi:hypothetical protein
VEGVGCGGVGAGMGKLGVVMCLRGRLGMAEGRCVTGDIRWGCTAYERIPGVGVLNCIFAYNWFFVLCYNTIHNESCWYSAS